jgi:hypothetical protein
LIEQWINGGYKKGREAACLKPKAEGCEECKSWEVKAESGRLKAESKRQKIKTEKRGRRVQRWYRWYQRCSFIQI